MKIGFIWNGPLSKAAAILEGERELFWYGITIGQIGIGILISRKRKRKIND